MRTREKLLEYANQIKGLGYKVYISKDVYFQYGYIVNEKDEIGYFQLDDFGTGVVFSTKHKPANGIGCGFGLDDSFNGHREITKELVDRCFAIAPNWATRSERQKVVKWTATEYLSRKFEREMVVEL